MIYVVTGKTGHGKTAYCMKWVKKALKNGDRIYANTKINPEKMFSKRQYKKLFGEEKIEGDIIKLEDRKVKKILYWQNFSDWQYMEKGLVLCDEGVVYFDAHNWTNLPQTMRMKFVQHRKDKLDLLVNVQHYTFIDKTLRVLCERFINIELKFGSAQFKKTFFPRISKVTEIDLPTLNRTENLGIDPYNLNPEEKKNLRLEHLYQEWFWIKKSIFTWYDTAAKMVESRPEDLICNIREAPCGFTRHSHA